MKEEGIPFKPVAGGDGDEIAAAVRETVSRIVDVICSQEVDDSDSAHNTMERQRETGLPGGVAPVAKADADRVDAAEEERREELLELVEAVRDKARKLLSDWSELKEVFKIPKRELVKMRAEHEREADRAAMARSSFSAREEAIQYKTFWLYFRLEERIDIPF